MIHLVMPKVIDRRGRGLKTSQKNVTAKIDWLQIIFYQCSIEELLETLLKIEKDCFLVEKAQIRYKEYDVCYSYGSLKIYTYDLPAFEESECYLVFSGDACSLYERLLHSLESNWVMFFQQLVTQFSQRFKVKRLDIALDDRNKQPYFKVEQLIKLCKKKRYESRKRKFHVTESNVAGTKTSKTLYIGKRTSDVMFRIYDKDLETAQKEKRAVQEIGSWKRLEVEFKRDVAQAIVELISKNTDSLEELMRSFVKQELNFYSDDEHTKIPRFWERYLGNVAPLKIARKYEIRGLKDTEQWFVFGGGLSTLKAFDFLANHGALGNLQNMLQAIQDAELSRPLTKKVVDHLVDIGREDLIEEIYLLTKKENLKKDKVIQSQAPL
ncbi:TPA: replication initiation factor domain-containing protein [Enterococcus faecalis]|nr:replication initiation factor domain-containing protein [Enterococcus faecalis]EEI55952.1 replication initiation factor [Enterococcus faecalis EnGen0297]EFU85803.1 replication initiation factor [Enterococcus faecalis TX0309B]EFU94231.1 replication initiation factor [Enterococcus faecalis TX0309A]KDE18868.1 replication initiation factor [Enterococcus faecalis 918]MBU5496197.1 replication initiation factor domain-containing protein [Enterococcus sp. S171_ASV_20]MBU5517732.1 replication initi